jgi:hypothetical protein
MRYAEFWHWGTDGKLRPMCGSDGVAFIDGRYGIARTHAEARSIGAKRRQAIAYVIREGGSVSDSRPLMEAPAWLRVNSVPNGRPVHPTEISADFLRRGKVI